MTRVPLRGRNLGQTISALAGLWRGVSISTQALEGEDITLSLHVDQLTLLKWLGIQQDHGRDLR